MLLIMLFLHSYKKIVLKILNSIIDFFNGAALASIIEVKRYLLLQYTSLIPLQFLVILL